MFLSGKIEVNKSECILHNYLECSVYISEDEIALFDQIIKFCFFLSKDVEVTTLKKISFGVGLFPCVDTRCGFVL